jgi:hypothetical protein
MPDPKSRARVERLLCGPFRPDDLTQLFLYARDHCDGREPVAEIGHFVAHHNERDKGIVTRSTREWFAIARYHFSRFGPGGPHPLRADSLPPAARDYFKIALNRINAKNIAGSRRADARKIMLNLADRLVANADGTWAMPSDYTQTEFELVEHISSVIVIKPAFEADRLVEDFIATLKSNGLIKKEEMREHRDSISTLVQLYAVAAMHNCVIQIGDGTTTQLKAYPALIMNKKIEVGADVPNSAPGKSMRCSIFTANLDPAIHCHSDLLVSAWDFEVELNPDGLLAKLG